MTERLPLAVVLVRQQEAWRKGAPLRVEQLLAEYEHLASSDDAVLDLIYSERLLREERGEAAPLDEYLARFPRLEASLRVMFEIDESLSVEAIDGTSREPTYDLSTVESGAGQPAVDQQAPRLEGLELLGELGRGAMGVVYRGWQKSARRPVAVKVLDSDVPVARARTEAEAAARLTHPNIVQTYEVRQHGERTALVLEYVEGGNLAQKIAGRPQPPRDAARFVEVLAWAMAYAHARGVIHRDLKPSNVLLSAGPDAPLASCVPKISDFGLAKLTEGGLQMTRTNEMLGTPSYMPPEQAGGGGGRITSATDVWALGAILYELLTGRPPFLGEGLLETIEQVLHQDPVPPSRLQPTVPHDLEVIALKCLHKSPARRYATARELAEDLRRFQAHEPIRGRSVGRGERVWKWARRHPTAAVLILVCALAGIGGLYAGLQVNQALRGQRDLAREQAREREERLRSLRQLLYTSQLLRIGSVWPGDPEQGLRMLEDSEACPPELRCFSWGALYHQCKRYRERLPDHPAPVTALAHTHQGDVTASGTRDGEVLLWRGGGNAPALRLRAHDGKVTALAFRLDGRALASGGEDGKIKLWALDGKALGALPPTGPVAGLAWHPDHRKLAVSAGRPGGGAPVGEVAFYDTQTYRRGRVFAGRTHPLSGVAVSPDGTTVAGGGLEHAVLLWDARTGHPSEPRRGHTAPVTALLYAPDSQALYTGSMDSTVRVWSHGEVVIERDKFPLQIGPVTALALHPRRSVLAAVGLGPEDKMEDVPLDLQLIDLANRTAHEPIRGHQGATGVAFRAGGAELVTAGADRSIKRWDFPGQPTRLPLRGGPLTPAGVAVARDTELVAWIVRGEGPGAEEVLVRDLAGGEPRRVMRSEDRGLRALALSPDGRWLATSAGQPDDPAELLVWEVATGQLLHHLSGRHSVAVDALAFSPDGKHLFSAARDGQVRGWAIATGKPERLYPGPGRPALALAVSGDGSRLALLAGDGKGSTVRVWQLSDGELLREFDARGGRALALGPTGELLAHATREGAVRLVEVDTAEARGTRGMGMNQIASLAFSPDGQVLAVAGSGTSARLWDVPTWQERAALPGHRGGAVYAGFSRRGHILLTASDSGTARLWPRARP